MYTVTTPRTQPRGSRESRPTSFSSQGPIYQDLATQQTMGLSSRSSVDVRKDISSSYVVSLAQFQEDRDSSFNGRQDLNWRNMIGSELSSSTESYRQIIEPPARPILSVVTQTQRPPVSRVGTSVFTARVPALPEASVSPVSAFPVTSTDSVKSSTASAPPPGDSTLRPAKPKKRREKPHIDLAPDQPPTTQGKPRARVYVACIQCRTRKIRCDGAKPVCHNCGRRTTGNSECNYDTVPKRRGPDKTPGARQRMARDVRCQLDNALIGGRRRRRTQNYPSEDTGQEWEQSSPPPEATIVLPTSLALAVNNGTNSSYDVYSPDIPDTGTSYSCLCHGMSACAGPMGTANLVDNQKNTRVLSRFNDGISSLGISALSFGVHPTSSHGYITEVDEDGNEGFEDRPDMVSEPPLSFARDMWWESLLFLYMSPDSRRLRSFSPGQREAAAQGIASDLRFVFRASNYWFSFFHIPTFFGRFFDPIRRKQMQPSLVLALLAMSTFWQSSEVGIGHAGRERALRFRDEAQGALEASVNAGWLDETLAQAAWLLALFEVCAHPRHSSERCVSALVMLDSIIRSLSLTFVDADDPTATMFLPGTVPAVLYKDQQMTSWFGYQPLVDSNPATRHTDTVYLPSPPSPVRSPAAHSGCSCRALTLGEHWPQTSEHAPMWGQTPAWDDSWSESDIRKESIRRLCWSAMVTAAGHISYTTAHRSHNPDLFIADPANYALLFSGESIAKSPSLSTSSKDTVWALQDRCFLLWHACIRMRTDRVVSDAEKAQFATKAWLEADALEAALNKHTCSIERAFIYQAREYIFNTRMSISYEFQRYIPLVTANINGMFHRRKAEEWLRHQGTVAERFMHGLHTITGNANNLLARRPFFVFWFMSQISRSLSLWECDNTLTIALDVCKALLPPIDYLSALWPCQEQRHRYHLLRERLYNACYAAGVDLPPPPNFSLPNSSSPEALV